MSTDFAAGAPSSEPSGLRMSLRFWPVVLFFSLAMILNPFMWVVMDQSQSPYLKSIYYGVILGELILVGLVAGLLGRHWLVGFAIGLAIALIGLAVVWQITDFQISAFRQLPWFWRACHIPATLFFASLPLLVLRLTRHWRISLDDSKGSIRLEDIFIFTSIVGCIVVMLATPSTVATAFAKLASRYDNVLDSSNLMRDELQFAAWGALSLFLACPLAFIILDRNNSLASRWKGILVHLLLITAVVAVIFWWQGRPLRVVSYNALPIIVAYFTVVIGLLSVRACGFQLHGKRGKSLHLDSEQRLRSRSAIWLPRIALGSIIAAAIYSTLAAGNLQRRAQNAVDSFSQLKESFLLKGGVIDGETHRTASYCIFGDEMDDADLSQLQTCLYLERLDLSDSKVTDDGFKQISDLRQMRDFDLSNTSVGDATLEKISQNYEQLRSVNLSHTKISAAGIRQFARTVRVAQLHLSDNGLTDSDFEDFKAHPRTVIHLYGNPITEACIQRLAVYRGLGIGRNQLSPDWPEKVEKLPEVLCFQGSDIDDNTCASLSSKTKFIDRLFIENTSITDAGLAKLATIDLNTLEIGPGSITDDGLARASLNVAYQLKLSGSLTGSCLKDWKLPWIETLDLSESQVSDEVLESIVLPASLRRFGVGNTKVTEVGLQRLRGMQLEIVNIARAPVAEQSITDVPARLVLVEIERSSSALQTRGMQSGISIISVVPPVRILDDTRQDNRFAILRAERQL